MRRPAAATAYPGPPYNEECDDGNKESDDGCDFNCTLTACGNSIINVGEECDDGNDRDGDNCDSNCSLPRCGNGITAYTARPRQSTRRVEECDDGNRQSGDGCDHNCTETRCGNGIVTGQESCDDGNVTNGEGATITASFPAAEMVSSPGKKNVMTGTSSMEMAVTITADQQDAGATEVGV